MPQSTSPEHRKILPVATRMNANTSQLGIPTANIPVDSALWMADVDSGVYFGYAGIQFPSGHSSHPLSIPADVAEQSVVPESKRREGWAVFPMVMSIGYNPFYKNKVRSAEVHVLHPFKEDFYGSQMALDIFGFIRPEYDYVSKESLIKDIQEDCRVAERSLAREKWSERRKDGWLWGEEEKVAASTV